MAHFIGPVIIVGKAAQAGFDAADDDGHILIGFPHAVGIDDGRPFRPVAGFAAWRIVVAAAEFLGCRLFIEHGIEIAGCNQSGQPRPSQFLERFGTMPVGLGNDTDTIAPAFQYAADEGCGKTEVIDIGVAIDVDKIELIPAAAFHVLPAGY